VAIMFLVGCENAGYKFEPFVLDSYGRIEEWDFYKGKFLVGGGYREARNPLGSSKRASKRII
jgi:hypothetical protein